MLRSDSFGRETSWECAQERSGKGEEDKGTGRAQGRGEGKLPAEASLSGAKDRLSERLRDRKL